MSRSRESTISDSSADRTSFETHPQTCGTVAKHLDLDGGAMQYHDSKAGKCHSKKGDFESLRLYTANVIVSSYTAADLLDQGPLKLLVIYASMQNDSGVGQTHACFEEHPFAFQASAHVIPQRQFLLDPAADVASLSCKQLNQLKAIAKPAWQDIQTEEESSIHASNHGLCVEGIEQLIQIASMSYQFAHSAQMAGTRSYHYTWNGSQNHPPWNMRQELCWCHNLPSKIIGISCRIVGLRSSWWSWIGQQHLPGLWLAKLAITRTLDSC